MNNLIFKPEKLNSVSLKKTGDKKRNAAEVLKFLTAEWVKMYDDHKVYTILFKHFFKEKLLYQVVVSGSRLWDGIYAIRTAYIEDVKDQAEDRYYPEMTLIDFHQVFTASDIKTADFIKYLSAENIVSLEDANMLEQIVINKNKKMAESISSFIVKSYGM